MPFREDGPCDPGGKTGTEMAVLGGLGKYFSVDCCMLGFIVLGTGLVEDILGSNHIRAWK